MRKLKDVYAYIKAADPDTALSMNAVRQMVISGKLPSISAGNRYLVNLDVIDRFLSEPERFNDDPTENTPIRKIIERGKNYGFRKNNLA